MATLTLISSQGLFWSLIPVSVHTGEGAAPQGKAQVLHDSARAVQSPQPTVRSPQLLPSLLQPLLVLPRPVLPPETASHGLDHPPHPFGEGSRALSSSFWGKWDLSVAGVNRPVVSWGPGHGSAFHCPEQLAQGQEPGLGV